MHLWSDKLAKSGFVPPAKTVARYSGEPRVALGPQSTEDEEAGHAQQPPFPVRRPTFPSILFSRQAAHPPIQHRQRWLICRRPARELRPIFCWSSSA
jgi:hypothetical protein